MLSAPAFRVKLICPSGFILVSPEPANGQTACFVNHCLHAELLVLLLLLLLLDPCTNLPWNRSRHRYQVT